MLNILGGMDTSTSGDVIVNGNNIANYSRKELTAYRREDVGFVFQFYNLVPNLTAKENVELAAEIVPNAMEASEALNAVGLGNRMNNFPAQLSGGEQQRVAIAGQWLRIQLFYCVMSQLVRLTIKQVSMF